MVAGDIESVAEPRRQVWHFALLIAFMFALIASQVLGRRPLLYGLFNNVAPAGALPASVRADLAWWQIEGDTVVHRSDWSQPIAVALGHADPARPSRLGWVVREWSVLSMPLAGWRQSDLAVVREDSYGYQLSALTTEQRAKLDAERAVGWFPWWRYVWGWLPLAALAGAIWAELRWQATRRAALGIM